MQIEGICIKRTGTDNSIGISFKHNWTNGVWYYLLNMREERDIFCIFILIYVKMDISKVGAMLMLVGGMYP